MLLGGHRGGFARLDTCRSLPQRVGALDGAPDPVLGGNLEQPGPGQQRDVAVQAPGGNIVEFGGELSGGQRPVAEERLDNAQPHRVQQQDQ